MKIDSWYYINDAISNIESAIHMTSDENQEQIVELHKARDILMEVLRKGIKHE